MNYKQIYNVLVVTNTLLLTKALHVSLALADTGIGESHLIYLNLEPPGHPLDLTMELLGTNNHFFNR